jgi:spore coat polysaccharide biosynthesis protein SpsF
MKYKIGIIVQARLGSTRLPGKMLLPFYQDKSILEIILDNLKSLLQDYPIIVATSDNPIDDKIEETALKCGVHTFRGPEDDVLQRFILAAETHNLDCIVRVCADNPFLMPEYITNLIEKMKNSEVDYLSYQFSDGTPIIKSHIGMFTEIVKLSALQKIKSQTTEQIFLEHVTNYIYSNLDYFKVKFLNLPDIIFERKDIRLTVDTKKDFEMTQKLYSELNDENYSLLRLINVIDANENYKFVMSEEIRKNSK